MYICIHIYICICIGQYCERYLHIYIHMHIYIYIYVLFIGPALPATSISILLHYEYGVVPIWSTVLGSQCNLMAECISKVSLLDLRLWYFDISLFVVDSLAPCGDGVLPCQDDAIRQCSFCSIGGLQTEGWAITRYRSNGWLKSAGLEGILLVECRCKLACSSPGRGRYIYIYILYIYIYTCIQD